MKRFASFSVLMFVAGSLAAADSTPTESVNAAAKKLGEILNSEGEGGGSGCRIGH